MARRRSDSPSKSKPCRTIGSTPSVPRSKSKGLRLPHARTFFSSPPRYNHCHVSRCRRANESIQTSSPLHVVSLGTASPWLPLTLGLDIPLVCTPSSCTPHPRRISCKWGTQSRTGAGDTLSGALPAPIYRISFSLSLPGYPPSSLPISPTSGNVGASGARSSKPNDGLGDVIKGSSRREDRSLRYEDSLDDVMRRLGSYLSSVRLSAAVIGCPLLGG